MAVASFSTIVANCREQNKLFVIINKKFGIFPLVLHGFSHYSRLYACVSFPTVTNKQFALFFDRLHVYKVFVFCLNCCHWHWTAVVILIITVLFFLVNFTKRQYIFFVLFSIYIFFQHSYYDIAPKWYTKHSQLSLATCRYPDLRS